MDFPLRVLANKQPIDAALAENLNRYKHEATVTASAKKSPRFCSNYARGLLHINFSESVIFTAGGQASLRTIMDRFCTSEPLVSRNENVMK